MLPNSGSPQGHQRPLQVHRYVRCGYRMYDTTGSSSTLVLLVLCTYDRRSAAGFPSVIIVAFFVFRLALSSVVVTGGLSVDG